MNITFVSQHAYPLVNPDAPGEFGGAETKAVLFAQGLAAFGTHQVQFLARNPALQTVEQRHNVAWHPWPNVWNERRTRVFRHLDLSNRRRPRLRSWDWRLPFDLFLLTATHPYRRFADYPRTVDRELLKFPGDLFCCFGNNQESATVIATARRRNLPVLMFLASDADVSELMARGSRERNTYGLRSDVGRWNLQHATALIAQTPAQQQLLAERFGRTSTLIPNPFDQLQWSHYRDQFDWPSPWGDQNYVLWIGRAENTYKRPLLLIELAERSPELRFLMLLNPNLPEVEQDIRRCAPANVRIVDRVPYRQMPAVFENASALVSTSWQEGFPNVFLQAIASRVPIVSYNVGQDFLAQSRAGFFVDNQHDTARQILQSLQEQNPPAPYSADAATRFLEQHYSVDKVCRTLAELIDKTLSSTEGKI